MEEVIMQPWGKTCTKCNLYKKLSDFSPAGKYFHSRCKPCRTEDMKERYTSESRRERSIKEHGLTVVQYLLLLEKQNGSCSVCGKRTEGPYSLYIDHDHNCCPGPKSCGECVRGLLCSNCNTALGLLDDDIGILASAIKYLKDYNNGV